MRMYGLRVRMHIQRLRVTLTLTLTLTQTLTLTLTLTLTCAMSECSAMMPLNRGYGLANHTCAPRTGGDDGSEGVGAATPVALVGAGGVW